MPNEFPDATAHTPTHAAFNGLVLRIGRSLLWIAKESGISYSRVRMLSDGYRMQGDKKVPVLLKYPEQFTLERLADMEELGRRRK